MIQLLISHKLNNIYISWSEVCKVLEDEYFIN